MSEKDLGRRHPRLDEDALTAWGELPDEDDLVDAVLSGDFVGAEFSLVAVRQSRVEGAAFTGARLIRASFVDCVIVDSEWSRATLENCRFERVEFRRCRMSGVQAHGSRFADVALLDCKADEGNFRMTEWEARRAPRLAPRRQRLLRRPHAGQPRARVRPHQRRSLEVRPVRQSTARVPPGRHPRR